MREISGKKYATRQTSHARNFALQDRFAVRFNGMRLGNNGAHDTGKLFSDAIPLLMSPEKKCLFQVVRFRTLKVFKLASPTFLCITLAGCVIMYLEVSKRTGNPIVTLELSPQSEIRTINARDVSIKISSS